ncbi:MAG: homing endonuclease associated repeat-containing protein, partial [Desulfotomaculales bacterium]
WDEGLPPEERHAVSEYFKRRKKAEIKKEEVLKKIRELAAELGRPPKITDANALAFFAIKYFGSWNAALQATGIPVNRVTLPKDQRERDAVFRNVVQKAAEMLGRIPTMTEYRKLRKSKKADLPDESRIIRLYGSWEGALEAAGFPRKKKFTKEDAEKIVSAYLSEGRKFVFYSDLPGGAWQKKLIAKAAEEKGLLVFRFREGKEDFQKAAELGFPEVPGREKGRSYAFLLMQGRTFAEIAEKEGYSRERVRQLVRKYVSAVAKREKGRRRKEIDLGLIAEKAAEHFGSPPSVEQYGRLRALYPELPHAVTIYKRFGRWPFNGEEPSHAKKEKVAVFLRQLIDEKKNLITQSDYKREKLPEWPSAQEIVQMFGSWREALYEALTCAQKAERGENNA